MLISQLTKSDSREDDGLNSETPISDEDTTLSAVGTTIHKPYLLPIRVPSVSSEDVVQNYINGTQGQLQVTDVLTGRTIGSGQHIGINDTESLSIFSGGGASFSYGVQSASATPAPVQRQEPIKCQEIAIRQPVAASHDLKTVFRPFELQGPERFAGKKQKPAGKFISPTKPKHPSPTKSGKDMRLNIARDVSKFQRDLALKEARYPKTSPRLLEYLESFVAEECRARGVERVYHESVPVYPELDTRTCTYATPLEGAHRLFNLERELGVYFEALDTFMEALDVYKPFLLSIKRKYMELVGLYRQEIEQLPKLKAKLRAEKFNEHEALDICQSELRRMKVENKALRSQMVADQAKLKETTDKLAKVSGELTKTEVQAANYAANAKRTRERSDAQRVADFDRLKALTRTIADLEKANKQVKREAERHADLSRIKVSATEHEKTLHELSDLKRTYKVLKSQHNKLSKKTRRLTIAKNASLSPKKTEQLKNTFDVKHSVLFKHRTKDTPGGQFLDTAATISSAFDMDFARATKSGSLLTFIGSHDADVMADTKTVEVACFEVCKILEPHYSLILHIHQHYSAIRDMKSGNHGITSITVDPFCRFLEEVGTFQNDFCSRNACLVIFAEANFEGGEEDDNTRDLNDDNALMRFEFIECLVRVAFLCYGSDVNKSVSKALQVLVMENIIKCKTVDSNRRWSTDANHFRRNVFYTGPVEKVLRSRNVELRSIYEHYSRIHPIAGHGSRGNFGTTELHRMFFDAHMIQQGLVSNRTAQQMFARSRLFAIDEVKSIVDLVALTYVSFLELLCRLAAETFDEDQMDTYTLEIKAQTIETFIAELIGGLAENLQIKFSKRIRSIDEWERDDERGSRDAMNDLELTPSKSQAGMAEIAEDADDGFATSTAKVAGKAHVPVPPNWELN